MNLMKWVFLILLTACWQKTSSTDDDVLVIAKEQQASWIRNFNPLLASGGARWPTRGGIYEPLLIFNRISGEWQPWLATDYHWSEDLLALDIELRQGLRWSDGKELSIDDVAFSFQLLQQNPALDTAGIWSILKSLEVIGKGRLRFHLKKPFVPGLQWIAQQLIVPQHIWSKITDPTSFANPKPVGSGPYTEVLRFDHQVFELGQNSYYWQELGPKRLRFPAFSSNEQANLALISGELDWAGNFVPAIDRIFVAENPEHHRYWFPLVGTMVYLYLNSKEAPYDQVQVRHALSLAIDREQLAKIAMYQYTKAADASGLSESLAKWKHPKLPEKDWTSYQPERAKAILAELGLAKNAAGELLLADGKVWELTLTVVSGWSDWIRAAQMIARDLQALGIRTRVRPLDFSAWFDAVQRGDFQASIGWSVESTSPYEYYRWLMAAQTAKDLGEMAPANWHRFGDERVDKLLAAWEASGDPHHQRDIAHKLQELFVALKPALPLFANPAWGAFNQRKFSGFPHADDPYAVLSPNSEPDFVLVLTRLRRQGEKR